MAEALGQAVLELRTDNKALKSGFRRALGDTKRHLKNVAKVMAVATVAIAGVSIKMAADMEKGLREIGTLMGGLTDNEMRAMGHELETIASRTGQAMDLLTKARYDIVSAGFASAAESAELLRVSADLATAGVTDIVKAGDLLTTTMNAYGIAAKDAELISDKLFTTVRLGKTTIEGMAGSLGRVLGVAGTLGIDLDELLAIFATLTTTMGSSERATTATAGAINALLTPTKELKRIIKALGHESALAMIEERGFADSIRAVVEKAKELNIPITDAISSMEGLQGILPLTGTAADTLADNIEGLKGSLGASADAAAQMQLDFTLQMNRLKQNIAGIMRAIGRSLIDVIQPRIEEANTVLQRLGDIGWDVVAATVIDNWRLVLNATVQVTKIIAPAIGEALKTGIRIGLEGISDIFHDLVIKIANVFPGKKIKLSTEKTTLAFQDMGDSISVIITNLVAEIERLAVEAKPPLEDITDSIESVGNAAGDMGKDVATGMDNVVVSANKLALDAGQALTLFSASLGTAFGGTTTAGEAFKGFVIGVLNLIEGVIIAAAAMNGALTFAWVPVLGAAGVAAALVALEVAKAGVQSVKFAHGGIINAPTMIPIGAAVAQVAEAGRPEGILPLERLPGGDLGVQAAGIGPNVTLSVTVQSSVIANRQTVRELLEPPLIDLAQKLQSKLLRRP